MYGARRTMCIKAQLDSRMLSPETVDDVERDAAVRSVRISHAEAALLADADMLDQGDGIVRRLEDAARLPYKDPARFGQLHPPAGAVEQLNAQFPLEPSDLLAECWLGDVLSLSRTSEMHLLGQADEVAQLS